jgi:cell division protein ZapA
MEELSVKIKIGGRVYPMRVQVADEKCVRTAGKLINEQIKSYSAKFGIHDQQDLLAMVALGYLIDTLKLKNEVDQEAQTLEKQVDSLVQLVEQVLT